VTVHAGKIIAARSKAINVVYICALTAVIMIKFRGELWGPTMDTDGIF
jgi:hypothetical protein